MPAPSSHAPAPPPVPEIPQREAIKVLVVTWNMGDALPKGDLSVLLGHVPPYQPHSPVPGLPSIPVENQHPYHIVVVAGQECPTPSGVPRGLGGGIMKGVMPGKKEDKDKDGTSLGTSINEREGVLRAPEDDSDEDDQSPAEKEAQRIMASSPLAAHHHRLGASKGWSNILDGMVLPLSLPFSSSTNHPADWFCGPSTKAEAAPFSSSPAESPTPPLVNQFLQSPQPPNMVRAMSAPVTTPKALPIPIPSSHSPHPHLHPVRSPLARSQSSMDTSSSEDTDQLEFPNPFTHQKSASTPIRAKMDRPEIVVPLDVPGSSSGTGPYIHVMKERLLGMYLSVYVYKGCEHLVQGMDKDFVTAGLAGGRLGNKGGIGISLKLADHRFLFVNTHLAAHAGRQHARLANIAKIKSELRLDCFLPKDDPRATEPDITDRFDTVFWMGDLNFRLDVTRLHADWLVQHKLYSEALKFDQLRNAMADPSTNPFPGFQEAEIDFAPTFKYDVWKSVRNTNRHLRRSIRRRKTVEHKERPNLGVSAPIQTALSHVPEAEHDEEGDLDAHPYSDPEEVTTRRSLDLESNGYTSAAPSGAATDAEDDFDSPITPGGTRNPPSHRGFETAIKEKSKHFLSMLKMDGILTPSSPKKKTWITHRQEEEFRHPSQQSNSRRTSLSSMRSFPQSQSAYDPGELGRMSLSSERRPSLSLSRASPPPQASAPQKDQPIVRRFSALKRSVSGRSVPRVAGEGKTGEEGEEVDDPLDDSVDTRLGVYDSSKKQRVPSWCDRVLWKAHVVPDTPEEPPMELPERETPFHRLTQVFSNFGGHLRNPSKRTLSIEPSPHDRVSRIDRPILGLVESPTMDGGGGGGGGLIPAPRASSPSHLGPKRRIQPPTPPRSSPSTSPSPTREGMPPDVLPRFGRKRTSSTSMSGTADGATAKDQQQLNAFTKFLKDLPNILHRTSINLPDTDDKADDSRRRKQKGEVVCLHYGTIDDEGMRRLEGRSDHRPAIFAAAVYV
ncbi:hypothetical protein P7C73_g2391, partial [Tremellales sp. Uapishka_1]